MYVIDASSLTCYSVMVLDCSFAVSMQHTNASSSQLVTLLPFSSVWVRKWIFTRHESFMESTLEVSVGRPIATCAHMLSFCYT